VLNGHIFLKSAPQNLKLIGYCLSFSLHKYSRLQSGFRGRLLHPPTSLSIIGHFRELSEIRAYAGDLPSHADPEREVLGANRPNFANPLCARFPHVRPHAIGGVPIGGSEAHARKSADIVATVGLPVFLHNDLKVAHAAAQRGLAFYGALPFYNCIADRASGLVCPREISSARSCLLAPTGANLGVEILLFSMSVPF
jgi:hypothetical protein